ncbi:HU family DNA-binding protein [Curvibacter sp. AEP1-3]|uniref:HU family DNA-binding protein n=1 Tax=Curvibacter sp. AEP1-3 TaxID=1844971 RepID=UPI001E4EDA0B|nr:HU family DNA-binding protein [Curvibacter sp. AEP1-3]
MAKKEEASINRSDLIRAISARVEHINDQDAEMAVRLILDAMAESLKKGRRIEIRNFGVFQVKTRMAVVYRNPRTGEKLKKRSSRMVRFKEGKNLRKQLVLTSY